MKGSGRTLIDDSGDDDNDDGADENDDGFKLKLSLSTH